MHCLQIITSLALLAHVRATPIRWISCGSDLEMNIECGTLEVPLDYFNPASNATLQLSLRKIPAVNAPSKGSILLNYGGPGLSGLEGFSIFGSQQMNMTGGNHDLITFDPRGTGNDSLRFICYNTEQERMYAQLNDRPLFDSSDVAPGEAWGLASLLASNCGKAQSETGALVGTAFTARDMMKIVDALGEDGMLRYWGNCKDLGLSYGTILGATVAKLFPERMDAVVLDAVVNVREYYQGSETIEGFTDAEATFDVFIDGCVANPSQCSLARNRTSSQLKDDIFAYLDHIRRHPLPLPNVGVLLNYATVKSLIFNNLWFPDLWPGFSAVLDALLSHNLTALDRDFKDQLALLQVGYSTESRFGIECSDSLFRTGSLQDVLVLSKMRIEKSVFGDAFDFVRLSCAQWPFEAKERYVNDDFHIRTRNPVLFIGNSLDPTTPLVSARNVSAGFEGSVLLQQDGFGHTSLAQKSSCTWNAIAAYFNNGLLPERGTVCSVDVPGWGQQS